MGRKAKPRPAISNEAGTTSSAPASATDPKETKNAGSRTVNIYRHELNGRLKNLLRELKMLSEIEAIELGKQQHIMKTITCLKRERETSPQSDQTEEPSSEYLIHEELPNNELNEQM